MSSLMRRAALRRPAARRAALACGALALALLLSTCGFIGLDMFPPELMNVEASVDLSQIVTSIGATLGQVRRIESLTSSASGVTYVFAMAETSMGPLLIVLDGTNLTFKKLIVDGDLNPAIGVDVDGNFQCGKVNVKYADLSFLVMSYGINDGSHKLFSRTGIGNLVFFTDNTANINYWKYPDWDNPASPTIGKQPFATSSPILALQDAEQLPDGKAVLLFSDTSYKTASYVMRFTDANTLDFTYNNMAQLELGALDTTQIPYIADYQNAWLTADGIVALSHDMDTRMTRYSFISGAELDYKLVRTDWKEAISFDPSGDFWYYYDRLSGKLYKLRTWWK